MAAADLADVARTAALRGGEIVRAGRVEGPPQAKGAGDYVTDVDLASERAISEFLRGATPDIPVVAEEGGGTSGARYWIVDPLDGTTNFVHGFPVVGVSVALVEDGRPVVGAVHAPFLDDVYVAARGRGARIERSGEPPAPIHVASGPPNRAIVGTGFPFRQKENLPAYLRAME